MSTYKMVGLTESPESLDNCPVFLERYLDYLGTFRGRSPSTVIEAYSVLTEYFQYIHYRQKFQEAPPIKDAHKDMDITQMELQELCTVSEQDIEEYLCFLDTVVRNASMTVRKKLVFIRTFYGYLDKNAEEFGVSLQYGNPAKNLSISAKTKRRTKIITEDQIRMMIHATSGAYKLRDTAIIMVIATTGITLNELALLNIDDVNGDTITIRKDRKASRYVYMTEACTEALERYIASREAEDHAPLFTGIANNRRMTHQGIHKRIEKVAALAGLGALNITASKLRDFAACNLLKQAETPIAKSQILSYLGYATSVSGKRFEEVLERHDP